jgi:class 3 adenylate cyclase
LGRRNGTAPRRDPGCGRRRLKPHDEAGTLGRLRALRKEFIEQCIAARHCRVVKRMGDGALVEFPSVVEAVQCAVEIQRGGSSTK